LSRSIAPRHTSAGFTLIEALVALAIIAALFSPIAALIATSARGTRSIEQHLTELEIARTVVTALPERDRLVPGTSSGEIAGYRWQVDVSPFVPAKFGAPDATPWVPHAVVVTVRSPTGALMQIDTVRLRQRPGG
jgi:general secretion pathway protein I